MRISTSMIYDAGVSAINRQTAALLHLQQQVATGIASRAGGIADSIDLTLEQTMSCDSACTGLAGQSARLHAEVSRFRVA
jgi:methyl-accepting chemotaxis protein